MAEERTAKRTRRIHHSGRFSQIGIYLGKQLRFFISENDWKVLPMAAIIAGLVGMVIRNRFFINMEGSLIGAFALTCVAIWNGCFNSIQSICRERGIVKREHRSGMHVSSYICAHMLYQLMLCLLQTGLSIYVLVLLGVPFPLEGFMTPLMVLDIGITMLLVSYAADMLSLFISSVSHTTTGAMTVMPFVLIFQLVFSGGVIPLPAWSQPLSNFTISNYGIQTLAAQSGYNELPMVTAWNTLSGMRDKEMGGTFTLGQVLDLLDSPGVEKYRDAVILSPASSEDGSEEIPAEDAEARTLRLGPLLDALKSSEALNEERDQTFTVSFTLRDVFDIFGEEKVKALVQQKTAEAAYNEDYARTRGNILGNWMVLGLFILFFAFLATLSLELIDKDKR
ncbi:MAG: ABC transporter permease [Clostridia bacterium]|nr:ABC transporter permease [Clostridia bacterium]